MKALLLKDFRAYRFFYLTIIILMLLYSFLNIRVGSVDGIIGLLVIVLPSISGFVLFAGDQALLYYITSLPVSRKEVVLSKYLGTFIFGGFMVVVTILIIYGLGFYYPNAKTDLTELLSLKGILFSIIPITSIVVVSYPLIFKYGLSVAVQIIMFGFALFYGLGIVVVERVIVKTIYLERHGIFYTVMKILEQYETSFGKSIYIIVLILLCILVVLSIRLSIYWFNKKDII